jgi:SAM-dependent methyltransferase
MRGRAALVSGRTARYDLRETAGGELPTRAEIGPWPGLKEASLRVLRTAALPERHFDDPVAAYDELAPYYANFSAQRAAYLWSIEDLIVRRLPRGAKSLLDVGSGDGLRARRLAAQARIERVVLVEPSPRMVPSLAAGCFST